MAHKNEPEKDELTGVEKISPQQAQEEMKQAVKRAKSGQGAEKKSSRATSSKGKAAKDKDELEDVEAIPKEQALAEMRAAAERARKAQQ